MTNRKRVKPTTFQLTMQPGGTAILTIEVDRAPLEVELSPAIWQKLSETVQWFEKQKNGTPKG